VREGGGGGDGVGLWEGRTRREGIWDGMMVDTGAGYSLYAVDSI
jgi:hypothetical protein